MKSEEGKTISQKITKAIITMSLCASLIIGVISVAVTVLVSNNAREMYEENVKPLDTLYEASVDYNSMRLMMRNMLLHTTDQKTLQEDLEAAFAKTASELDAYAKDLTSQEEQENYDSVLEALEGYEGMKNDFIKLINAGQESEAQALLTGGFAQQINDGIDNAFILNTEQANEHYDSSLVLLFVSIGAFLLLIAVFVVISIWWSKRIAGAISTPIIKMVGAADAVAAGNLNVDVEVDTDDETKLLSESLKKTITALRSLKTDISMLVTAASEGEILEIRADVTKHEGDYRELIRGVNSMLDGIKDPLVTASVFIDKMADGAELEVLENPFKGAYAVLIDNLKRVRESLYTLLGESIKLGQSGINGELEARADEALVQGGYRQILHGFNEMLDAIINPLNEADVVLGRMSHNDYTASMSEGYRGMLGKLASSINSVRDRLLHIQDTFIGLWHGDTHLLGDYQKIGKRSENDMMIPSAIGMMTAIEDLIQQSDMLAEAALNGDLTVRGSEGHFEGGYQKIISGFNKTLEAIALPIEESSQVLQELAAGNLTVTMANDYKGEYNRMKTSLNQTIRAFNELLSEISSSASQVSAGSKQVSDASQMLAQGATEQASTIEELTSSITEVSRQTKENAKNALNANELSQEVQTQAAQGNDQMIQMLAAMGEINESSANISKIIKVIDDIAFQTNILALNAAVEAARAGQYGKGFAVVAEEVRNLAAKSAEAAKDTTALIEGSVHKVDVGTKIANETAQKLSVIAQNVQKCAVLVGEIADASNEQATAIAQVDQGLEQVSMVVQTNSATAEESAASSEELSGQANILMQMVSKFTLSDTIHEETARARPLARRVAYSESY